MASIYRGANTVSVMRTHSGTVATVSVEDHLNRVLDGIHPLATEQTTLVNALGRTLAEAVRSVTDIPLFDNSSMDGYAVHRSDLLDASREHPVVLPVVAELAAGTMEMLRIAEGSVARIMTGAPIPAGADAVVPLEHTDQGVHRVAVHRAPAPAAYIRRAGDDIHANDEVLVPETILRERHLAAAASAGHAELVVNGRPRVAVISTGNELVEPGEPLQPGQIPDSNSILLQAAVQQAGGTPIPVEIVPDAVGRLADTLDRYANHVDAFLISGGVSLGAYDVVKGLLAPHNVWFGAVRMQPGKPQGFGHWLNGVPIFALPGNPVSALVSFEVFVRPALRKLQGLQNLSRPLAEGIAAAGWDCPPARRQYMPIVVLPAKDTEYSEGERLRVRPATTRGSGSHLVASLAAADGFAVVDESIDRINEGDRVAVMLVDS